MHSVLLRLRSSIRLCFAFSVGTSLAAAQTNTFPSSGNVGIGTTAPNAKLDVQGTLKFGTVNWTLPANSVGAFSNNYDGTPMGAFYGAPYNNRMAANSGMSVFTYGASSYSGFSINYDRGIWGNSNNGDLYITTSLNSGIHFGSFSNNPFANTATTFTEFVTLNATGNVGIKTMSPDAPLTVKGRIHATEVVVDTSVAANDLKIRPQVWADDVFDAGHALSPLSQVEQQIKRDKHLPGIPSAAEVAAHGISVGDMQARLLAKIEELTLHQIAQEKRLAALERENAVLKAQLTR